jgi:hypothetical protein
MVTASFFVFFEILFWMTTSDENKKDIVDSGIKLLKKRDIGRPTSLYILKFRNIVSVKSVVKIYGHNILVHFFARLLVSVAQGYQIQNPAAGRNYSVAAVICASI